MSTRHEDNDGSDIFWPGYVDATTNLILNLLFLLTILMVAVFMFALELGRSTPEKLVPQVNAIAQETDEATAAAAGTLNIVTTATVDLSDAISAATTNLKEAVASAEPSTVETATEKTGSSLQVIPEATEDFNETVAKAMDDFSASVTAAMDASVRERIALAQEIERLNILLSDLPSENNQGGGVTDTVEATSALAMPLNGLDKALTSDFEVVVRFMADAIEFMPEEHDQLIESLKPITSGDKAAIYVEVPTGFSEAKRMGFYRAMAVRNLLIEMDLPQENIDVKVVEGSSKAKASIVRVRPE
jgi:hypothetical protein